MEVDRKRVLPFIVLGAGILVFIVLILTGPKQPPVEIRERAWQVEVTEIRPADLSPTLTLYGSVETPELMKAAAPSESRVEQVLVREGDSVVAGQLLLTLDPRDYEPRVEQARAEVNDLESQIELQRLRHEADVQSLEHERKLLELARAAVGRAQKLKKQNMGSDAALDDARDALQRQALAVTSRQLAVDEHAARMQQLEAGLRRTQAELDQAERDRERSQVKAPFVGVISQVHVAAGDQVKSAAALITLYPIDGLEVRARIPAPFQPELHRALQEGALQATATLGGQIVPLRLERMSGEADPSGVDALFSIESGAALLRVGSMVTLRLKRPAYAGAVPVPYEALYGSNRIYKLVDGRMQAVAVEALGEFSGADGETMLLVSSPELQAGDRIITTHLPNAVSGLKVTPVEGDDAMSGTPDQGKPGAGEG